MKMNQKDKAKEDKRGVSKIKRNISYFSRKKRCLNVSFPKKCFSNGIFHMNLQEVYKLTKQNRSFGCSNQLNEF